MSQVQALDSSIQNAQARKKSILDQVSFPLLMGVLGVVYGDIGTSPLYALRECFSGGHGIALSEGNVLAILSLIFWSLIIVVSFKYVTLILRADNNGEGGILALLALSRAGGKLESHKIFSLIIPLGLFGSALLYGDGVITPAISVLSAIEGLELILPHLDNYVPYIAAGILIALFSVQNQGTARLGNIFGPVMICWFLVLSILGLISICSNPGVLRALNPIYGLSLLFSGQKASFMVLGAVFLVMTGGEALYADMGHFGRKPIQIAWFFVALPALVMNYFGQGALLISHPETIVNPFYSLCPKSLVFLLVILSTAATIIASQAMITGIFSLTHQATQLGYLPRVQTVHTSEDEIGQIYLPKVNTFLLIATAYLVIKFKSSTNLASAYGIAVSLTMVITTLLAAYVVFFVWNKRNFLAYLVLALFLVIDLTFLSANIGKIFHGGFLPLIIGLIGFLFMDSWKKGRAILAAKLSVSQKPLAEFIEECRKNNIVRVPGVGVYLSANPGKTPYAMIHNVRHYKALRQTVILMSLVIKDIPTVPVDERVEVKSLKGGFYLVTAYLGFADRPHIPRLLRLSQKIEPDIDLQDVTYFMGRETLVYGKESTLNIIAAKLFIFMSQNAESAMSFFRIPPTAVSEVGSQVEI